MKMRVFKRIVDGVVDVRIHTEDWSENDRNLMVKYGEPEINLGGTFVYVKNSHDVPDDDGSLLSNSSEAWSSSPSEDSSSSEEEQPVSVTLDTVYARVMTESPFTHKFDSRDLGGVTGAMKIADSWVSTLEYRIVSKIKDLREHDSFFTTEEIMEY